MWRGVGRMEMVGLPKDPLLLEGGSDLPPLPSYTELREKSVLIGRIFRGFLYSKGHP